MSPRPGVYELTEIKIDKKIMRAVRERTKAAFNQTVKGKNKLNKCGIYGLGASKTRKPKSINSRTSTLKTIPNKCPKSIKRSSKNPQKPRLIKTQTQREIAVAETADSLNHLKLSSVNSQTDFNSNIELKTSTSKNLGRNSSILNSKLFALKFTFENDSKSELKNATLSHNQDEFTLAEMNYSKQKEMAISNKMPIGVNSTIEHTTFSSKENRKSIVSSLDEGHSKESDLLRLKLNKFYMSKADHVICKLNFAKMNFTKLCNKVLKRYFYSTVK